jgi:hypothetical protein
MLISSISRRIVLEFRILGKKILIHRETLSRGGMRRRFVDRERRIRRIRKEKETYLDKIVDGWNRGENRPSDKEISDVISMGERLPWKILIRYRKNRI